MSDERLVSGAGPRHVLLLALLALLVTGCVTSRSSTSITDPPPIPQLDVAEAPEPVSEGSLYRGGGGASLVGDFRARHVGDVLVVRISESSLGRSSADSTLEKNSETRLETPVLFGYENQIRPNSSFDPSLVFQTGVSRSFEGEGETTRENALIADLAVRVHAVGHGGQMLVTGSKHITVNREKQRLVLAGIVRPEDVGPNNVISSSKIADLTIKYGGTGDVADTTRQGWFQKLLDKIWPF